MDIQVDSRSGEMSEIGLRDGKGQGFDRVSGELV